MFENRRMPNGTSEPSLGLCGVGGRARKDSLYPIEQLLSDCSRTKIAASRISHPILLWLTARRVKK